MIGRRAERRLLRQIVRRVRHEVAHFAPREANAVRQGFGIALAALEINDGLLSVHSVGVLLGC